MSQPSSYNNYQHSRQINQADPLDGLVVRPGMEEGESDEDEDMIMFHETSSDILTTLEGIFLRYSSASVEPHSYPNHLKKQPLVKLSELGWAHVICCVQNWGSVCCTARVLRDVDYWKETGTILHYLLRRASNVPVMLVEIILSIQDCKGNPLGEYMCTDPDGDGNFPLHLACCGVGREDVDILEMLTLTDTDALDHVNTFNETPLEILLRESVLSCSSLTLETKREHCGIPYEKVFYPFNQLRNWCSGYYGTVHAGDEAIIKTLRFFYGSSPSIEGFGGLERLRNGALHAVLEQGGWPSSVIIEDIVRFSPDDLSKSYRTKERQLMYPFMIAAIDNRNSLDTVYRLLRQVPHLLENDCAILLKPKGRKRKVDDKC